jgi:hypothetical protein
MRYALEKEVSNFLRNNKVSLDRQTDRHTDRQTDIQTDRHISSSTMHLFYAFSTKNVSILTVALKINSCYLRMKQHSVNLFYNAVR